MLPARAYSPAPWITALTLGAHESLVRFHLTCLPSTPVPTKLVCRFRYNLLAALSGESAPLVPGVGKGQIVSAGPSRTPPATGSHKPAHASDHNRYAPLHPVGLRFRQSIGLESITARNPLRSSRLTPHSILVYG